MLISDVINLLVLKNSKEVEDDIAIKRKFLNSLRLFTADADFSVIFNNHFDYVLCLKKVFPMYDDGTIDHHLTQIYNYKEIREKYNTSEVLDNYLYFDNSSMSSEEDIFEKNTSREHTTTSDTNSSSFGYNPNSPINLRNPLFSNDNIEYTYKDYLNEEDSDTDSSSGSDTDEESIDLLDNLENKINIVSNLNMLNLSLTTVSLITGVINLSIMLNYLKF